MTIGEKIIRLRTAAHVSQEQLAEKIGVSRQSVSKWEMDQTVPQIDKLVALSEIFRISLDDMLKKDVILQSESEAPAVPEKHGGKYFDTDGFRGEANKTLTADHAYRVGRFLGWYYASPLSGCRTPGYRPRVVIGKDTRRSSYMLEYALAAGIAASGADACILHVTTTPSVSFITRQDEFDCGVMITASHNPFYDNGIKVVNRYGEKLDDGVTALIEAYLDGDFEKIGVGPEGIPFAMREKIGSIVDYYAGRNRYIGYLISLAAHSYSQLRIGLDCANGASWSIAKSVFEALGAKTYVIGAEPDGTNCNKDVGSTHIEALQALVREKHLDCGYAFDGDADRCIAVDENGEVVDGDKIIYILASRLKEKGILDHDTAVYTVMSNSGLTKSLAKIGIRGVQTSVGDRFVYECMQKNGYRIGGEQSGHIILRKYATTGDGILTAIMLTEQMRDRKTSLSALAAPVKLYPQKMKNVRVSDKDAVLKDADVLNKVAECEKKIGENGRILLRRSGTEPVVRVMAECESESLCDEYIASVVSVIEKKGFRV
ncbi:MAG: phosphoglucosamine mutase [Lachnospiraceae bacterium]|nr:phosphoglucosamine mutase [Lachnospiraceae bacterium]